MEKNLINKFCNPQAVTSSWELFNSAEKITFLTHFRPDADGASACAALSAVAEKLGKSVETVYPSPLEPTQKRESNNIKINSHQQLPDLIIMCDTANYERLYYPDIFKAIPSINIDHHISNSITATINLVTDEVSSTCELVYLLLLAWDANLIDLFIAESLLFGILFDSQTFNTQSTRSSTLKVAAELMDRGAHLFQLQSELLYNKNPQIISLWGELLSQVSYSPTSQAAWCSISQEQLQKRDLTLTSTIGFENFLAQLSDIDITIVFSENKDGTSKASLRSKKSDVNDLAKIFNGGGHKHAAGLRSNLPLQQLIQEVCAHLR